MTAFLRQLLERGQDMRTREMCLGYLPSCALLFCYKPTTGESVAEWQLYWSNFCSNSQSASAKYRSGVIWLAFEHRA